MAEPSKEQQFQAQIAQLQFDNQSKAKVLAEQANENVNLRIQVTQLRDMLNGVTAQNAELKKKVVPSEEGAEGQNPHVKEPARAGREEPNERRNEGRKERRNEVRHRVHGWHEVVQGQQEDPTGFGSLLIPRWGKARQGTARSGVVGRGRARQG